MTIEPAIVLITGLPGTGKSTLADAAGALLGIPVLSHDWAMSGLRPYPEMQSALDAMDPPGHQAVGWSILGALARSQLRYGTSVVLDGVARAPQIEALRSISADEGSRLVVVLTECSDESLHRSFIEGRERGIPDWYEVEWGDVERGRLHWEPGLSADLKLDAGTPLFENLAQLGELLQSLRESPLDGV